MKLPLEVGLLGLVGSFLLGAVVGGCSGTQLDAPGSSKGDGSTGRVGLTLRPVPGVTLNSVHYLVTKAGSAAPLREGDLPSPGTASLFNFALSLPVATGYTLSLSAIAVENARTTCTGSISSFSVLANTNTSLDAVLTCVDAANGSIIPVLTVATDACPRLIVDYATASPDAATAPLGTIALSSRAHDFDGKSVTYSWKASASGSFSPGNAQNSTFTCVSGHGMIEVSVTASNGECSKTLAIAVHCNLADTCGNGVLDPGEACDASIPNGQLGAGLPCLPNCIAQVCGNAVVEAPFETCEPTNATNCSATCQTQGECGDGILQPGEPCDGTKLAPDVPAGTICSAACTIIPFAVCGNGVKQQGELCDPPFTANDCGSDCGRITSSACFACENDPATCQDLVNCDAAVGSAAAGTPAAGTPKSVLCNQTLDCLRDSGCAANGNAPIRCYCGTANPADCQAGLGNGVCKAQLERSLETTAFATIAQRIGNPAFGGGIAMTRIDCDQTFCSAQCF